MSARCNANGDFSFDYSVLAGFNDATRNVFESAFGASHADDLKYAKLGNALTFTQTINHAIQGEWGNVAQDATTWFAADAAYGLALRAGLVLLTPASSIVVATAASIGVMWAIGYAMDSWNCDPTEPNKNPTDPFIPDPNGGSKDYRIEYYDPIILDLNSDGIIQTIDDNGYFGALFDHDGDGIRTATGWVDKEDGLLVRDIDGNGKIDNGKELFGDNTILKNGQKATSGMEALADIDDNADGIIDDKDQAFNSLKVWQDKNGDGISTSDELLTLAQAGITSINLIDKQTVNQVTNGGIIKESATFTKTDGSVSTLADVNFNKDTIHTRYETEAALSDAVAKLPSVYGSGRLPNIQQAAMKSDALTQLLEQYVATNSRSVQKSLLDNIMLEWAATDPQYTEANIDIMRSENIRWQQSSDSTNVIRLRRGEQIPEYLTFEPPPPQKADAELEAKVKFVDAMLGIAPTSTLFEVNRSQIASFTEAYDNAKVSLYKNLLNQTILKPYLEAVDVYTDGENMVMTFDKLNQLITTKYQANTLEALEDLKDLLTLNGAMLEVGGWEQGFVLLQQWRDNLSLISEENKAYIDDMFREFDTDAANGTQGNDFVFLKNEAQTKYSALKGSDTIIINTAIGQTVEGRCGDDIIVAGKGNDYLVGGTGRNTYIFYKGVGEDFVNYDNNYTGEEFDKLAFTDINLDEAIFYQQGKNLIIGFGNDKVTVLGALDELSTKALIFKFNDQVISLQNILEKPLSNIATSDIEEYINGWKGIDILIGNNTNNQIFGFEGDDSLTGGKGNDRLKGGTGIDTYHFSRGDGIDEVLEDSYATEANHIAFKDINPADIQNVSFEGNDLVIQYGQDDKIILKNYIANSHDSALSIQFADGITWHNTEIMAKVTFEGSENSDVINGTLNDRVNIINAHSGDDTVHGNKVAQNIIDGGDGWDTIYGGDNIDTIKGGTGEDFIYGEAGNDHIDGGDGHDTLFGGSGDDVIIGGDGNDWLQGDAGADILIGGLGDDSYDVDEFDTFIENADEGYDAIFIANDFDLANTNLEEIHLKGNGNFKAIGDAGDNGLYGNDGNNYLDGKAGADIMSGGAGDDYYVVDKYESLVRNADGTLSYQRGDQVVEGILHGNYVYGDSGGNDTVEQWDDHRFYSQDEMGNWVDTGSYHHLQKNIENLILKGSAKTAFGNELDNIITLNEQNNFVNGLGGNDTIIYQKGGGQDTISVTDSIAAIDTLVIQGYSQEQTSFTREQDSILIRFADSKEHIWITDYFKAAKINANGEMIDNKIDHIIFENNGQQVTLTQQDIDNAVIDRADNHAPIVNKYPRGITINDDEVLSVQFDADTIVDQDIWDTHLSYRLTLASQNADGSYQELPDWLNFDSVTRTLSGTPTADHIGSYQFILWAGDLFDHSAGTYLDLTVNSSQPSDTPIDTTPTNVVEGTDSNEQLLGSNGNDLINGYLGDDQLFGFAGHDTLNGGAGNDYLAGGNGSGTNSGNDILNGGAGDDTLYGEDGNDLLIGGAGNDSYIYKANHGIDIIDNSGGGTDVIFFQQIAKTQLTYHKEGQDLIILVDSDLNQQVKVKDHFLSSDLAIDYIVPSDGMMISAQKIATQLTALPASDNGDTGGGSTQTPVNPETPTEPTAPNNDDLSGDNTITDTMGNDQLRGGRGNDTYIYTAGKDTIIDTHGIDTLIFSNGITFNQVGSGLISSGNDLILRVNGDANNQVTIKDYFSNGDSIIETIRFETGGSISYEQIFGLFGKAIPQATPVEDTTTTPPISNEASSGMDDLLGTAGADYLQGLAGNDRLQGLAGNDQLDGGLGNDILIGGTGNDLLIGGKGDDLYYFEAGFGQDVINNTGGGIDNIYFDGLSFSQIASGLVRSNDDLILKVSQTTDQLTIKDFFMGGEAAVGNISFASGGSISADQIFNAYGISNPNPINQPSSQYQTTLGTMLDMMNQFDNHYSNGSPEVI